MIAGPKLLDKQLPLFHKHDPQSSVDAASKLVEIGELSRQEKIVYRAFLHNKRPEGYTARELAEKFIEPVMAYYMIQRRVTGLESKGKLYREEIGYKDGHTIYKKRNNCVIWWVC